MTDYLTLLRQHVHADDLVGVDDVVLSHYWDAAVQYVVRQTQRPLEELQAMEPGCELLPLPLQQAALMVAAHWYNQKETASQGEMKEVPHGAAALIRSYRKMSLS